MKTNYFSIQRLFCYWHLEHTCMTQVSSSEESRQLVKQSLLLIDDKQSLRTFTSVDQCESLHLKSYMGTFFGAKLSGRTPFGHKYLEPQLPGQTVLANLYKSQPYFFDRFSLLYFHGTSAARPSWTLPANKLLTDEKLQRKHNERGKLVMFSV